MQFNGKSGCIFAFWRENECFQLMWCTDRIAIGCNWSWENVKTIFINECYHISRETITNQPNFMLANEVWQNCTIVLNCYSMSMLTKQKINKFKGHFSILKIHFNLFNKTALYMYMYRVYVCITDQNWTTTGYLKISQNFLSCNFIKKH